MSAKSRTNRKSAGDSVLIIGAGIAGCAAATRLGRAGLNVFLVEKSATIGGRVREMGCKADDACLKCNVCVADEIFRSVAAVPGVSILTDTEATELAAGENKFRYRAVLKRSKPGGAKKPETVSVNVNSVVLAAGYEPYAPSENSSYGYGRVANVITGADAERQLAAGAGLRRPSDGDAPGRIAFVQCAGSRSDETDGRPEDAAYCSCVCCAYALRTARRIAHSAPDSEITFFYMDIQNFGQGFNGFYEECRKKFKFVRARPFEIGPGPGGSALVRHSIENSARGSSVESEFDLVVLSVGIRPPPDADILADALGAARDEHGFFGIKGADALSDTQREGIYAIGAAESPRDIAGCIAQAGAVCAMIAGGA